MITTKRLIPLALCVTLGLVLALWSTAWGQRFRGFRMDNGFDLSYSVVPPEEIFPGGPAKDGIPALTNPRLLAAKEARYLYPKDLVLGVVFGGEARAYPLRILVWHENANDEVGGVPIAVTYCPLCNSAFVFDRRIGGQVREFGVSGLLWNSNVLLYDRQADRSKESLWSQVKLAAVTGPAARSGLRMKFLPSELTTWAEWTGRHPATTVLSNQTGYARNYGSLPYRSYFATDRLMFPTHGGRKGPDRFRKKEPMVLVQVAGKLKAYAVADVAASAGDEGFIEDRVGDTRLRLIYVKAGDTVRVETLSGDRKPLPVAYSFWFAVNSIMPDVELFEPSARHAVSDKANLTTSRTR